ncbi:MAG TPA: MarR family transcriptional regulator [Chthoniobacterales bacterium]|nr:MarR family transcriptional regulator [Chthoniobacterales bacterium]
MLTMTEIDPETVGQLVQETGRIWRNKLDQRLRPLGLSQAKWRTLAHLSRGHLTQCDLAQRLGIEEPTLARLLGKLEQARWIKRESAVHDRRCKTVHLQPKSSALLEEIQRTARDLRHELIETVSPRDLQICLRVLTEIRNRAAGVSNASDSNGVHRKNRNGKRHQ